VEAEAAAAAIVADARAQAETLAKDAAARMEEFIVRRTKQAESKIAFAEAQAAADVRAAAADHSARAAEIVLRGETRGPTGEDLVTREISALKSRLN
jgi:F-type H+-transporting ATPase subunit b